MTPTEGTVHSASGQALGYFHQCMWALVELGRRAAIDPSIELRLECLDDIEFGSNGSPTELLQTKHQIRAAGAIGLNSVDLWRTINVWMDVADRDRVVFRLVTTQGIQSGSPLEGLRAFERNTDGVAAAFRTAAAESANQTTAGWRARFLGLQDDEQNDLLERIVIDDHSAHASDLDSELAATFRYAIAPGRDDVFFHLIRGWWTGIAVQLLSRQVEAVSGTDLLSQVAEVSDQLKSDTLPVDPAVLVAFDESIADSYVDREFVQQLLWVALDKTRLWKAIRDYHRSFTQRSFWLRHQLVAETELDRFAFRLHDEWEQVFDSAVAAMRREGRTDEDLVGQEILEQLALQSRSRLRERFDEPWFNRGLFHALADGELGQRIGWHPGFEERLEDLLADVTA